MLVFLIAVCVLASCKASSPSQYVSPRITGTVLDSQTRQPLKDVRVRRLTPDRPVDPNMPPRGGQVMVQNSAIFTAADGRFVLESVRDLALLRKLGWYTVSLSFERTGFERLVTNYTPTSATRTPQGEPVVDAGDVLLRPQASR